jgi:hypothetical protein
MRERYEAKVLKEEKRGTGGVNRTRYERYFIFLSFSVLYHSIHLHDINLFLVLSSFKGKKAPPRARPKQDSAYLI